ncbi:MAG: asparagine synthase-related protein, partial [Candidatus Aminicenantales bacterium]
DKIAAELRCRLERSIERRLAQSPRMGVWLSGGLDSSVLAALAAAASPNVVTFSAGVEGASDLAFARDVASFLGTEHHVRLCTVEEMMEVLPRVIYHLESFDAPLVRSSIANYLVAGEAAGSVRVVLSGEGADELFAGYSFLKNRDEDSLRAGLAEAQGALQNTALQRVDRMAAAYGTRARTGFLDPDVVAFANALPGSVKVHGPEQTEKWILRKTIEGNLPEAVVWRPKEKFWSGSGISEKIADVAERVISDGEFSREREIGPDFALGSREDLYYWRIFRRWFPHADVLGGMGRTVHRENR